jgi:hypothetical protein
VATHESSDPRIRIGVGSVRSEPVIRGTPKEAGLYCTDH